MTPRTLALASKSPTYPTHIKLKININIVRFTGSFRPSMISHLHRHSTAELGRDSGEVVTPSAGRNLPDKEFRYLRTVIVTAAVAASIQSFDSEESNTSS